MLGSFRRAGLAAAALAGCLCLPARASAQNTDSFFFSDEAAIGAGAVAATIRDSGAIWYNPAGLGGVKRGQVDLSASAFGLRVRRVPDAFTLSYPSGPRASDVSATSIVSAPVALGFLRQVSDEVTVGFGLFVTARDIVSSDALWTTDETVSLGGTPTALTFKQRLDQSGELSRYHAGPAFGWQVRPGLRVGAGLLGSYGTQTFFRQFVFEGQATGAELGSPSAYFGQNQVRYQASYVGLQPHLGVQWEADRHWRLGAMVRSPEVLLTGSLRASVVVASQSPDELGQPRPFVSATLPVRQSFSPQAIAPARAVLAVAWADERAGWVSAEADYQPPLKNDDFGLDAPNVINARLGGLRHLGPRFSLGAGLFTERAITRRLDPETFLAERLNYYGATLGLQLRTPLALVKNPQDDALVLSTTVALRYALGVGQARGAVAFPVEDLPDQTPAIDVVYHEFIPYLGSSTTF